MRKFTRGGLFAYGSLLVALAALAVAGAAYGDHWEAYNGNADTHELQLGDPPLCPSIEGGISFRVDGGQLSAGGQYPAGDPVVEITGVDVDGGTLSWKLLDIHDYDVAAVVMKGGPNAMVYRYDAGHGGLDDSDTGITTPIDTNGEAPDRPYEISHVDFCFDPKDHIGPDDLVVTKTAETSWEKVYTWDVEKSVDKSELNLKPGETGTVQWKVDVTQTGSAVRNARVGGTITVHNPNATAVTGVSVTDVFVTGGLASAVVDCDGTAGEPNTSTGLTVPANGDLVCTYTATVDSTAGGTNQATATGTLDGVDVSDSGTVDFTFGDPTVEINETVRAVDGKNTWNGIGQTSSFPYNEQFPCSSKGRENVVDLLGDNPSTPQIETDYELDTDSASVTVRCSSTPPPPPPPPTVKTDEFMDVQVAKDATAQVQLVNGQATVAYTVRVKNNGPNQAHDVKVVDAAPSGVTFLSVTQQPTNGSCAISGGVLLQCSLGTLGPGVERVIGLSARVTQTGTYVNCATATGDGKDTNGANNRACASTLVTAPVTPPTTKPKPPVKPKPKPLNICRVLKVTPSMVKANGARQIVLAKVTRSKTPVAGVRVRFSGTGLAKVVKTNKRGIARLSLTPSKAGIMLVKITSAKACNNARIGVVGVFEPPVTG
jgi:uncharacterized repeat protein (TIGR01451 family)